MSTQTTMIREALEYGRQSRPRSPLFIYALAALSELDAQPSQTDEQLYKQGQQDRWVPIAEGTPSGHVWLTGHAYNDPRTGDYWQKPGYYHEGSLYADDDFDPWDGYPPTHWIPALPSPPNNEQR